VLIFLTSGHAQTDKRSERQAKLIKTQGSLEHQHVRCGLQDQQGKMCFGTLGEGVYKYDGKSFTQLTMKDGLSFDCSFS